MDAEVTEKAAAIGADPTPAGSDPADLANRTLQGVSWSGISQLITQSLMWILSIFLARLLGPRAYGLIGMVNVFTNFAIMFGGLGFGVAIVQRKELSARHLSTAFWLNLGTGGFVTLLMFAAAPLIARFYREPMLIPLTRVISLWFLFDSLDTVQSALLRREMRFRRLGAVQIGTSILSGSLALSVALSGGGVWSLTCLNVGGAFLRLPLLWTSTRWRPSFCFDRSAAGELLRIGGPIVGLDSLGYWMKSVDSLVIGRFMGAIALGIWTRAQSLMVMPMTQVSTVVGNVMIPALSSVQDDLPRFRRGYLTVLGLLGLIICPMMVGMFTVADHLISVLLGSKWIEVIPILRIMCGVGLLASVGRWEWLLLPHGRTTTYFCLGVTASAITAVGYVVGVHWGLLGMAWATLLTQLLTWYPLWKLAGRPVGLSFQTMCGSVASVFFCSLAMGAVVFGTRLLIPEATAPRVKLALEVLAGIFSYFLLVLIFRPKPWLEARRRFLIAIGRPSPAVAVGAVPSSAASI